MCCVTGTASQSTQWVPVVHQLPALIMNIMLDHTATLGEAGNGTLSDSKTQFSSTVQPQSVSDKAHPEPGTRGRVSQSPVWLPRADGQTEGHPRRNLGSMSGPGVSLDPATAAHRTVIQGFFPSLCSQCSLKKEKK